MAKKERPRLRDAARTYLFIDLAFFHIVPLGFLCMGETGQGLLSGLFLTMLNPLYTALSSFIYALKNGFWTKYLLIKALLGALSVLMYYGYAFPEVVGTFVIMFAVYGLAALAGMFIGKLFYKDF